VWTHLAVADDPADPFTGTQLDRFATSLKELADAGVEVPLRHAANSAAAIAFPAARFDWVRCGIALYGHLPAPTVSDYLGSALAGNDDLRAALSLKARVHMVRPLDAGERTSYGRTYQLGAAANIAVVPLGYHDGIPRALATAGASVLIGGKRRRIAGTVTMDQIMVDCGDDLVHPGDEVVLIGRQGDEEISAEEWAELLSTIVYEVLCGIGPRVPRVSVDSEA
jgi:alanine racemase